MRRAFPNGGTQDRGAQSPSRGRNATRQQVCVLHCVEFPPKPLHLPISPEPHSGAELSVGLETYARVK